MQADTNVATQVHTNEIDGYSAIQLDFGEIGSRRTTEPLQGHFRKVGAVPRRHLTEVRTSKQNSFKLGQEFDATAFGAGGGVGVSGTTKSKGFAGVMKRHGFAGIFVSHGAHRSHRKPGSIGTCAAPGCIFKGLRMADRTGGSRHTVQSLTVQAVDAEKGLLLISGAIPGPKNGVVLIRSSVKDV